MIFGDHSRMPYFVATDKLLQVGVNLLSHTGYSFVTSSSVRIKCFPKPRLVQILLQVREYWLNYILLVL